MCNTSGHRPCHRATLPRGKPVAKAPGGPFAPAGPGTVPPLVRAARVFAEASRAGGGTRVALPGPALRGNPVPRTGKRLPAGWRSDCCFSTLSGTTANLSTTCVPAKAITPGARATRATDAAGPKRPASAGSGAGLRCVCPNAPHGTVVHDRAAKRGAFRGPPGMTSRLSGGSASIPPGNSGDACSAPRWGQDQTDAAK